MESSTFSPNIFRPGPLVLGILGPELLAHVTYCPIYMYSPKKHNIVFKGVLCDFM